MSRVLVVGGGLAGLAAAVALAGQGVEISLFERRSFLGGRASSFLQPSGETVDNCQHVLLGCCTNLIDFYQRLGAAGRIRWQDRLLFQDRSGQTGEIYASRLPAPLHLAPAFLRFPLLGAVDKLRLGLGMLRLLATKPEDEPFSRWLKRTRQTPRAIEVFWRPVLVSALNEDMDRLSARYAFQVFRDGFLAHRQGYRMGVPAVPLRELYERPVADYLAAHGGRLHLGAPVRALVVRDGQIAGLRLDPDSRGDGFHPAASIVSAVPFDVLPRLLPSDLLDREPLFAGLANLAVSPITSVHLWFDRTVTEREHAVLVGREMQWMFNKTHDFGPAEGGGSYLGLVVSASRDLAPLTRDEVLDLALKDVREAFPAAQGAIVQKAVVVKEQRATFSPAPSCDAWRPPAASPVDGLFLAGDWVQSGWPATMEGAVRSGYLAAEAVLRRLGRPAAVCVPDLPAALIPRLLRRW